MNPQSELVNRLVLDANTSDLKGNVFEITDAYKKIVGIVERTHIAMGKKQVIKISSAASNSDKFATNVCPPTH